MKRKKTIKKVYVPKWVAWYNLILMTLVACLILYINSIVPENEKIPILGLVLLFLIFAIVVIIVFLSAYKKLPLYYLIEK